MKKIVLLILTLSLLLLSACSVSDPTETGKVSRNNGVEKHESIASSQTDLQNPPESQDPEKTGSKTADTSDRNGKGKESTPSGSLQEARNDSAAKQQANGSQSGTQAQTKQQPSAAPSVSSNPKPEQPPQTQNTPEPPAAEPSAAKEPDPAPATPEPPAPQPAEPEKPKSIYDYAFDASAIRSELIAIGQSMGLTHITEDDGIVCTPDTCSWASPVTASESFQGDNLKRALQNYVASMPSVISSYGGTQIICFTIYVQDNGGGSYTFYFLY